MGFIVGLITGIGFGVMFTGSVVPGLIILSIATLIAVIAAAAKD